MIIVGSVPFNNTYEKDNVIREIKENFNYQVHINVEDSVVIYFNYDLNRETAYF